MPRKSEKRKPRETKPGPRSKTQTPMKAVANFLGESIAGCSSDENQSFASAELENQTDYGLEFTTSQMKTPARDRPSTSAAQTRGSVSRSTNREETEAESEDISRSPLPPLRQTQSGSTAHNSSSQRQNTQQNAFSRSANNKGLPQGRKKPRKQRTPLQKQQRYWANVRKLQNRIDNLIPKASFCRVVKEILIESSTSAHRITLTALEALQVSSEMYLTYLFQDAYCCTLHRERVTLTKKDIELTRYLRGERGVSV